MEQRNSDIKLCGRCYDIVDVLHKANCEEKPEYLRGKAIGQYHCPDCGAMVIAGVPHPKLCTKCLNREHPGFDEIAPEYYLHGTDDQNNRT